MHIKRNTLINTYRTHFHAHKYQKALLHLSWNRWPDYLWWKNCFSWQTAAQIFSDGVQYMLRLLTWLRIAILQREVCYRHATAFVNQITSLFWQMQDSCPFTLCKLEIQAYWDVTLCDGHEGTMFWQNTRKQNTHPKTQYHTTVNLNPQQCWCENLKPGSALNFTVKVQVIFIHVSHCQLLQVWHSLSGLINILSVMILSRMNTNLLCSFLDQPPCKGVT